MHRFLRVIVAAALPLLPSSSAMAEPRVLDGALHHLRAGGSREWSEFPEQPEAARLSVTFQAKRNERELAFRLRQQDVKQPWKVVLNGKEVGRLALDENDTVIYLALPSGALVDGENSLTVEPTSKIPDDVRVGEVALDERPLQELLNESTLEVQVVDATQAGEPTPTPCRITVLNEQGALTTTAAVSGDGLAVRPGVIYSRDGRVRFGLPAGKYRIHAGRGFEYSVATAYVSLQRGAEAKHRLVLRREVATDGYVACDTHLHTLTYSGHGDSTVDERVITIAGEGIELPIATEHNRQISYQPAAERQQVRPYFTPVVGNEVTTAVGHFNVFPVAADGDVPDFKLKDGDAILDSIARTVPGAFVILNHGRDLHSKYRPFGPERHNAVTAENRDAWLLRAQGMEVINSGAQQTDVLQLSRDWMALLNRGVYMTPLGASDSHDVARFIPGQARTYIRCRDDEPGQIDVSEAMRSLAEGRVLVSCGLLTELEVDGRYRSGDLVPRSGDSEDTRVTVTVSGPAWTTADQVTLYVNGVPLHDTKIVDGAKSGVKWRGEWRIPKLAHDVHLVAIATGPGVNELYWPIAKPYQPTSPVVDRRVIGLSGAVWLDSDGDGKRTSALEYARRFVEENPDAPEEAIAALAEYDEAVASHVACLLHKRGVSLDQKSVQSAARNAGPHAERGFRRYFEAWREGEMARGEAL